MTDSSPVLVHARPDHAAVPPANAPPFLVAGIGASAGGLDAFIRLIAPIPPSAKLALVLVQHLAREYKSILPELLSAKTGMHVTEGVDGKRIEPGYLYVIQPDTHMAVIDGHLRVRPRPAERGRDTPIDHLFHSMAQHYGERAIGVVLSGGGSDGALGLQEIRAAGGITMAQDPSQAQVDAMPRAAIASGAVELVLEAEQVAEHLVRLSEDAFFDLSDDPAPNEGALAAILQVLRQVTGVDFGRYKVATVNRRIRRRMALHHLTDLAQYVDLLRGDVEEVEKLHGDILIHVTSFFRDPGSFEALKPALATLLAERTGGSCLRAWVPGCSTGEEVYSLAMVLIELLGAETQRGAFLVFGTDLSQKTLEHARAGEYPATIEGQVPAAQLERFFVKVGDAYRVASAVREHCVFARQDLTRDPPFSRLDVVMCRNLMIYLDQRAQSRVIGVLHYALKPGGVLVLGRSETVGSHADLFCVTDSRWKIYGRRPGAAPQRDVQFDSLEAGSPQAAVDMSRRLLARRGPELEVQVEANRVLVERYAPPTIVVNDKLKVTRAWGATAPYLELPTGEATLDVLKLIRVGLMSPLRRALNEARERGGSVRLDGVEFPFDSRSRSVTIEVSVLGRGPEHHFMICFEEPLQAEARAVKLEHVAADLPPAVGQLQQELADMRAHLQATIAELEAANEQLQAANEEVLSSNEELQSTNEELDTAREELQSNNEELGTVNDELQARNDELSRVNGDLLNLFGSVQIPILMVSSELRVRRFTPAAEKLFNLMASDVGRPVSHVRPNIKFPDLELALREVIDTVTTLEREVEDSEGNTYRLVMRPYKSLENRIDGSVIALFDVTRALAAARETGEAIISTLTEPALLLDRDLTIRSVNPAFTQRFELTDARTRGAWVFELFDGRWDNAELRQLISNVLPERANFQNFALQCALPTGETERLLFDGRRIESTRRGEGVVLLFIRQETHA